MKSVKFLSSALFILLLCLFSTSAFAQADKTGLILEAGISVPITRNAGISGDENGASGAAYIAVGVGASLSVGYKGEHVGIRLNQDIAGQFVTDSAIVDFYKAFDKKANYFLGGTLVMLDEYVAINSDMLLTFTEGVGAMYGAKQDFHAFWVDSDAAFAIKIGVGFHYFIQQQFGIGVNLEYAAALAIDNGVAFTHFIQPVISFKYIY